MHPITVTGPAVAATAVAMAAGLGTAAYTAGHNDILIITTDGIGQAGTTQNGSRTAMQWDCPGFGGTGPVHCGRTSAGAAGSL